MGQPTHLEKQYHNQSFAMAPGSCAYHSFYINIPANPAEKQDELAGAQSPARWSNVGSDKAPTKAHIPLEAPTPPFVPLSAKDLFTKFMKVFIETTQARDQELLDPQKHPLKAKIPETYSGKSHMDYYYFCQQCEDYSKILGATGMNCISFAATFIRSIVSLRLA